MARMGVRTMPSARQLLAAGRRDLVAAIKGAGGFLEAAQALGLRSQRKPAGYWDDEMNLGGWGGVARVMGRVAGTVPAPPRRSPAACGARCPTGRAAAVARRLIHLAWPCCRPPSLYQTRS